MREDLQKKISAGHPLWGLLDGEGLPHRPDRVLFLLLLVFVALLIIEGLEFAGFLGQRFEFIDLLVCLAGLFFLSLAFFWLRRTTAILAELTRSRKFMEDVLECVPPLCITGLDFRIRYANKAYLEIFHSSGEALPEHCYESRPGDRCRSAQCPLELIRSGRKEAVCEACKLMPGGAEHAFMISARPLTSEEGELAGVVEVFADVTRLKQLEEQVRTHRHLEGLATLAGGMAHDFNNLLTVVFGNQELAATLSTESRIKEILKESAIALDEARKLSGRLLVLADCGVDTTRKVEDIIPLARENFSKGLGENVGLVSFDCSPAPTRVSFVPQQMAEVFSSLAVDSLERMEGRLVPILFRSRSLTLADDNDFGLLPGQWLSISITSGVAVASAAEAARIFEPYYSARGFDNRKGRGIGMAVTYAVINRHGGRVFLSSDEGLGATVRIMLPAAGPLPDELDLGTYQPVRDGTEHLGRIFILDDEAAVADIIAELLSHLGYESRVFSRGEDLVGSFVALAEKDRPALVILDLVVPAGLGGLATLRSLQEFAPEVRALAVSGRSNDEIMAQPRQFGFAAALKKPFDFDELKRALAEALVSDR